MRIGLITPGFSADEHDWCIPALRGLVRELARLHDVHVFTLRYPYWRSTYTIDNATIHALGGATATGARRLSVVWRGLTAILSEHRRKPFDLLHGLWADEPGFLTVVVGRLTGVPTVVSLLGGEIVQLPDIGYGGQLSRINRRLTEIALSQADQITVGSSYLSELAQQRVPSDRLKVLPLGVDTAMFAPGTTCGSSSPLAAGEIKLLQVASLVPVKDQTTLLTAFARVVNKYPGSHLHLIGDGPLRASLQSTSESLAIDQHVTLHGEVPHEQLPVYYRAADLYVQSSRFESQGMAVLESIACGTPAVGTAVGVLPDIYSMSKAVPPGQSDTLADAVISVIGDEQTHKAMNQSGQAAVNSVYALRQTATKLNALYRTLASN